MSVFADLELWTKPENELGDGPISAQALRATADELYALVMETADAVEKLTAAGWSASMSGSRVRCTPPRRITLEQAERKFLALGINSHYLYEPE